MTPKSFPCEIVSKKSHFIGCIWDQLFSNFSNKPRYFKNKDIWSHYIAVFNKNQAHLVSYINLRSVIVLIAKKCDGNDGL